MSALSDKEQEKIKQSIEWAEKATSGEVRVCIESKCEKEAYERAVECFYDLKMDATALRNGVLVYVAMDSKKLAIIGDEGINKAVPPDFWKSAKDLMIDKFKKNEIAEGISLGVIEAGKQLKKYFPYQSNDINELPDDIVFLN
ncbi:TPM domain-containing protein [Pedobacter sp. SD-b]|uniref:TPM domain-containing protein n=1 Tax=Pedobacter segetis TaxID=2793069 RepID=A0ABS1BEZ1_9SPHI|nr:TPM domain-containing protein [Pedobacter segetis]MBK0381442.1 TPM domain-containing protein [Pedobacter segetis]